MTTETAVDCTTLAIEQVAGIIAGHAVFQSAVNATSEDEARTRIFKSFYRPPEQEVDQAFAVVFEQPGTRWDRLSDGTQIPKGTVFLHLGYPMELSEDNEGEERRFNNWHGQLAQAVSEYYGPGYRLLTTITDPPSRTHPKDEGSTVAIWEVGYSVEWSCF
jgi:hypothetical protein